MSKVFVWKQSYICDLYKAIYLQRKSYLLLGLISKKVKKTLRRKLAHDNQIFPSFSGLIKTNIIFKLNFKKNILKICVNISTDNLGTTNPIKFNSWKFLAIFKWFIIDFLLRDCVQLLILIFRDRATESLGNPWWGYVYLNYWNWKFLCFETRLQKCGEYPYQSETNMLIINHVII